MKRITFTLLSVCLLMGNSFVAHAKIAPFRMAVDESLPIKVEYNISNIAVGNPEIADVKILRRNEFLVNAIGQGVTTVTVWDGESNVRDSVNIEVIRALIPADLIQIKAQIVEVTSSEMQSLGIEWSDRLNFAEGVALYRSIEDKKEGDTYLKQPLPGIVELGTIGRLTRITADINFLIRNGQGRVLANPQLVARSGGEAKFWVGGEVPFIMPSDEGNVAVDWKEYGVALEIQPTGDIDRNLIDADIIIRANNLDYENAVMISGYSIPAIATREVTTSLQVKSGETIVISGLKQLVETKSTRGVPVLSKIPVIGYFFKSEGVDSQNTEVTAFLTPEFIPR